MIPANIKEQCAAIGRELKKIGYEDVCQTAVEVMSKLVGEDISRRYKGRDVAIGRYAVAHYLMSIGIESEKIAHAVNISRSGVCHGITRMQDILNSHLKMDEHWKNMYESLKTIME